MTHRRLGAALGAAAVLLAVGALPAAGVAAPTPTTPGAPTGPAPTGAPADGGVPEAPEIDRIPNDRRIREASGLTPSLLHDGVLWLVEDSGHPARAFAVDADGDTVATVPVRGVENVDWEAIAAVRDDEGRATLAIADIGDNRGDREAVSLVLVREPAVLGDRTVRPARVVELRYPDGPADAEALLADPRTNRLYVVTKAVLGAALYAVPETAWPGQGPGTVPGNGEPWPLEKVGDVQMSLVTDGSFLPDGRMLLRGYGELAVLPAPGPGGGVLRPLTRATLPRQKQGEGLAVVNGGSSVLLLSEGVQQPVLRVPVPGAGAGPAASTVADATGGTTRPAAVSDAETGSGLGSLLLPAIIGGVVLLVVLFGVVVLIVR